MTEIPGAVLIDGGLALLRRLRDLHEGNDDEGDGEDGHGDKEQRSHVGHRSLVGHGADEDTHQKRSQGTGEGVQGAADLDVLVALVAAAAEEVQHRVHHGVEHAHAEAAHEGTEEVHVNGAATQEATAGEPLDHNAHETGRQGDEGGLLVTHLEEHLARRDTHEQVGGEVHHVAHHAGPAVLALPDVAERGSHVGHEGDHREDEAHRDDGHQIGVFLGFSHVVFVFFMDDYFTIFSKNLSNIEKFSQLCAALRQYRTNTI